MNWKEIITHATCLSFNGAGAVYSQFREIKYSNSSKTIPIFKYDITSKKSSFFTIDQNLKYQLISGSLPNTIYTFKIYDEPW
jgi:hypothetical protein